MDNYCFDASDSKCKLELFKAEGWEKIFKQTHQVGWGDGGVALYLEFLKQALYAGFLGRIHNCN